MCSKENWRLFWIPSDPVTAYFPGLVPKLEALQTDARRASEGANGTR